MTNRKELALISLLCLPAALRVFIFSAGFPFFSNIDEDLHFDLITQYSRARVPRTFDLLKEQSLTWIAVLAAIVTFVTASEILIDRVVFASEHNWFHS